ncbi:MAG: hypothetical protein V4531_02210 [Actinomycetota bacterium]
MSEDEASSPPAVDSPLVPLAGSNRESAAVVAAAGVEPLGDTEIEATVVLRRKSGAPAFDPSVRLGREDFALQMGADAADVGLVSATLGGLGIRIVSSDLPSRRMRIAGPASVLERAFGTHLESVTTRTSDGAEVTHRNRTGVLMVPAALEGIVTAVLGLDDRPQSRTRFRIAEAKAVAVSYTPLDLAGIYRFPRRYDGSGQTIAIIELGGGYDAAELDTYFASLGITGPTVTAVGVDGAKNVPGGDASGADGEVLLDIEVDIEVAGALSPGAKIVVYFAPNTDAGFVDAVSEATHASVTPTAISISWGQVEDAWTAQARNALDEAFVDAAVLGITVTAAAGDNGSSDGAKDGRDHGTSRRPAPTCWPAAAPACGRHRARSPRRRCGTTASEPERPGAA